MDHDSATFAANDKQCPFLIFLASSITHFPIYHIFFSAMMISKNLRKSVLDWFSILFFNPKTT